jgi:AcrR family transcriptional regulator
MVRGVPNGRIELAARRPRRSHADRTATTRAKIIAAVNEAIADVGFRRTTASEIAQRAGVTWGAVQHHFGGKDGTLAAVLEDSFDRFAASVAGVDVSQPLGKRVSDFVDRAWEHFDSAHYRSTLEILLNYAGQPNLPPEPWRAAMTDALDRTWGQLFGDARMSRQRSGALQRTVISTLTGLASMRFIEGGAGRRPRAELEILKRALSRELEETATASGTR